MPALKRTLALIPQLEIEAAPAGCCGMAGAFGYESEHYDISMKMAELELLPRVRAAAPDTLLIADGISCRQQIRHGTQREVIPIARALELALA